MTAWTTPRTFVAGDPLTAAELNETRDNLTHLYERVVGYAPTTSSNVTRASATFADLPDLSFPVSAGKNYTFIFVCTWEMSSTSGGPIFSCDFPAGTLRFLTDYTGETSSTSSDRDWVNAADAGAGIATAQTVGGNYMCHGHGRYTCTTSGTFTMRYARNTAGTLTVHAGASLFVTSD